MRSTGQRSKRKENNRGSCGCSLKNPAFQPLFGLENAIVTPHASAAEASDRRSDVAVQIVMFLRAPSQVCDQHPSFSQMIPILKPFMEVATKIGKLAFRLVKKNDS
jgi:hypothetical protein